MKFDKISAFTALLLINAVVFGEETKWWDKNWHYRIPLKTGSFETVLKNYPFAVRINFSALLSGIKVEKPLDEQSIRLIKYDRTQNKLSETAFALEKSLDYDVKGNARMKLIWNLSSPENRFSYFLYFDTLNGQRKTASGYLRKLTDNLIVNPGFENHKRTFPPWYVTQGKKNCGLSNDTFRDGCTSLKLFTHKSNQTAGVGSGIMAGRPEKKYRFSFWTKCSRRDGDREATAAIYWYGKNTKVLKYDRITLPPGVYEWKHIMATYDSPHETIQIRVVFSLPSRTVATYYFDSVELKCIDPAAATEIEQVNNIK